MIDNDFVRRLVDMLERLGIPYMVTGSFASSYHGTPRATQDIDFVISATVEQLSSLIDALPQTEYYFDKAAALEAHRSETQFNIIDFETGWKVDLIIRKSRRFSREEFDRRVLVDFDGIPVVVATAEDVVIAKLEWAKLGSSQRQVADAGSILKVRANELDQEYLLNWVRELGLEEQWKAARKSAGFAD